ncbi:cyanovirin-N [Aspergillus nomiae NRRL 13137]|uniref:Cyanovirin-N n=1 Tax=Aspergillus nomiae NRRL (strain ATCC 15546 / NRRL 13137 / CBS 260.88 / M93) TaxID=1509407 RepID=A0A0L1JIS7_ASPN3|nr:cyanovirin-N [Aspergillus nomiae NRRL 13137]KNG91607.1 cyanovirin-N [Aspergillus nomiae NRRL 13137]
MSFHLSAEDIEIRDNHILFALLRNEEGELQESEIDLDEFLGNNDGSFEWDGENFSGSAENVRFEIEGDGEVPVLRAGLFNQNGESVESDVNLSERVINENGAFVFV